MRIYQINYGKLLLLLLPTFLRQNVIVALLSALTSPIRTLYNSFIQYKDNTLQELEVTPQVFSLRAALNRAYNLQEGFIIEDYVKQGEWLMLFDEIEYRSELLVIVEDDTYLRIDDESTLQQVQGGFIVTVPNSLSASDYHRIRTIINKHKLMGIPYILKQQ
jgi:hypothetical protein